MDPIGFATRLRNGTRRIPGRLYWRSSAGAGLIEELQHRVARPFEQVSQDGSPLDIAARFRVSNAIDQDEYVHRLKSPAMIDPDTGYVILPGRRLLQPSLPYACQAGLPSITRMGSSPPLRLHRVISLRDVHEANYFHFFNDVLTKIPLLRSHGLLDAPVLVGQKLWQQPFFQETLPNLRSKGLDLIDQGDRTIHAAEIIYCKSMPHEKEYLLHVLDLLDSPSVPEASERKIFLTRAPGAKGKRWLENATEVESLMRAKGFEVVEAGSLTVREQMTTLAGTRWLVAIHGAAMTNMIFRKDAPMSVLELFPQETAPPHYYWLATVFGHRYRAVQGSACGTGGGFSMAPQVLAPAIAALLADA